ncbi:MAG: HEPN domain-containing protein, partial [Deltaproteobacteria bacterium]|nr:HEPN domain-containing protein [Deltaproteobacteria bacterium]
MKKAEEYLGSAEILHKNGLYTPSVTAAYYCSYHVTVAAFLTSGSTAMLREPAASMTTMAAKFSDKLDPFLVKLKETRLEWGINTSLDYLENDALLRLYQTKEFFL